MKTYNIQKLRDENLIIFEAIMGSRAYGTHLPTSDTDIRGIFIQPLEDILGYGKVDQVADTTNDVVFYEVGRFLDLLHKNNPNILELLNVPKDCIRIQEPIMDVIFENKDKFITKKCRWSFAGYAIEQIKKARGLNKKMNWEESEMVRKTVLDFCYTIIDIDAVPIKKWLLFQSLNEYNKELVVTNVRQLTQKDIGLAKIDHARDLYAMFLSPENEKWVLF